MYKYTMPPAHSYDLAIRLGALLQAQGKKSWETWSGKLSAAEQRAMLGFYVGRGNLHIDGTAETVTMTIKACFGADSVEVFSADAQRGQVLCEGQRAPITELSLASVV